jgi:hypothetical protein
VRQKLLDEDGSARRGVVVVKLSSGRRLRIFHAVAAKLRSRNRNSQFGLLGQIVCATTTAV